MVQAWPAAGRGEGIIIIYRECLLSVPPLTRLTVHWYLRGFSLRRPNAPRSWSPLSGSGGFVCRVLCSALVCASAGVRVSQSSSYSKRSPLLPARPAKAPQPSLRLCPKPDHAVPYMYYSTRVLEYCKYLGTGIPVLIIIVVTWY